MSSEILAVPEDCIPDVIKIIRAGLKAVKVPRDVRDVLTEWCDEEEAYLKRLADDRDA